VPRGRHDPSSHPADAGRPGRAVRRGRVLL
jgi:hypothetical protein